MKRNVRITLVAAIVALAVGGAYATSRILSQPAQTSPSTIQVVAAENFWGSLVSQLGGTRVSVTSIVTDPNADPHEYQSSAATARAVADARYIIVNGAGYDSWALSLIAANNSPNQKVLNVADLLGKTEGDNPHFWYGPSYVNQTVHQMFNDLVAIDPNDASYFRQQYLNLNASLSGYNGRIAQIAQKYTGRPVASTESIFQYLATAAHLDLISPYSFMQAVAEGNEPSPPDIITFQSQLINGTSPGNATLLVYNEQTVTPLTQQMKTDATSHGIPVVGVTETIQPPDVSFEDWMYAELLQLQNGLNANALGQ